MHKGRGGGGACATRKRGRMGRGGGMCRRRKGKVAEWIRREAGAAREGEAQPARPALHAAQGIAAGQCQHNTFSVVVVVAAAHRVWRTGDERAAAAV